MKYGQSCVDFSDGDLEPVGDRVQVPVLIALTLSPELSLH